MVYGSDGGGSTRHKTLATESKQPKLFGESSDRDNAVSKFLILVSRRDNILSKSLVLVSHRDNVVSESLVLVSHRDNVVSKSLVLVLHTCEAK
jgi:hypothetical protein